MSTCTKSWVTEELGDGDQQELAFSGWPALGFAAGDANLYRYVSSNPAGMTDPSGMFESGGSGGQARWQPSKQAKYAMENAKLHVDYLKKMAKETKTRERFGVIERTPKRPGGKRKGALAEFFTRDPKKADEKSHKLELFKGSGGKWHTPYPVPGQDDNHAQIIDLDYPWTDPPKAYESFEVFMTWHTHPPVPDGDPRPSTEDEDSANSFQLPDIVIQYAPAHDNTAESWRFHITDIDGTSHEFYPESDSDDWMGTGNNK